jgi:cytoskeletal protein CcmA (bactofilin family)
MSTTCPECNRALVIEDVKVKGYTAVHMLETCGKLVIPKRKHVVVQAHVVAHAGIVVDGRLECGQAISQGPVMLGPKADWRGDLRAPSLVVAQGAKIQGGYFSIPEMPKVPT